MRAFRAFAKTNCDKGYVHGYDRYYDNIFENYTPNSLLEIGIFTGNSLAAWRMMFPDCYIRGIDITTKYFKKKKLNIKKVHITMADSTKPNIRERIKDSYDVIIDDGSHYYKDIMRTFKNFHDKFNDYYIIEDYYYDLDLAKKYINSFGFYDVSFHISNRSRIKVSDNKLYRTSRKTSSIIDQNMIVIKR